MLRIYGTALETISELRPWVVALERVDADLARQMRRALASVALNISEGAGSKGRLRKLRYHSAFGSALESQSCIEVAGALHGAAPPSDRTLDKLSHVAGALAILSR